MKLIVGLGNPGKEYEKTRHNVGFMVLDRYLFKHDLKCDKDKFNGKYCEFIMNGEKYIFLEPQKYMNLSGEVVSSFVSYFKIDISDILIINDDLDLEIGRMKIKKNSGSGGHNGLKNIELCLGTNSFARLKIGISNNKSIDTKDYVLGSFSKTEMEQLDKVFDKALLVIDDFGKVDFEVLMSKYN